MTLVLLKSLFASCVGCGIVAGPIVGVSSGSSFSKGSGSWTKGVFFVSSGGAKHTKLFVEKISSGNTVTEEKFELKALYKGKEIKDKFLLCSPAKNEKDYYLLKLDGWGWRQNLDGISVTDCNDARRDKMGEKIEIEVKSTGEQKQLLQEIDLSTCVITDLRKNNWKYGEPLLELKCQEKIHTAGTHRQEIILLSKTFGELK